MPVWYRTRPTLSRGEAGGEVEKPVNGSDVRLRKPLYAVTTPLQIRLPLLQLSGLNEAK